MAIILTFKTFAIMKKTMYFVRVEIRRNYWVNSKKYESVGDLLKAMTEYVEKHQGCAMRFLHEETIVPE